MASMQHADGDKEKEEQGDAARMSFFADKLEKIAKSLERSGVNELVQYRVSTKKMIRASFIGGLFRGLGMAVGFTVLGAVIVYVLQWLARANLPLIGEFLAKIVRLVESKL